MKINALILLKNRRVKHLKVNPEKPYFIYNNYVYILDQESVGLRAREGILSPKPFILFHEGLPTAIRLEPKDKGESAKLLNQFVLEMNLKANARMKTPIFSFITKYLDNPEKLFGILALLVAGGLLIKVFFLGGF